MSFSKITQYVWSCDKCGEPEVLNQSDCMNFTKIEFEKDLRNLGWKLGKKHTCPKCSLNKDKLYEEMK